jgi:hypothetical protein
MPYDDMLVNSLAGRLKPETVRILLVDTVFE